MECCIYAFAGSYVIKSIMCRLLFFGLKGEGVGDSQGFVPLSAIGWSNAIRDPGAIVQDVIFAFASWSKF